MVGWFSLWRRPLRPIWPVFKRFGLTNVQLLNSCTGWTKHILRALPPTDTFGVAAFVWISLRGGCHPKGFGALGARLMSCIFHAWFQILEPPFANIITVSRKMLRPCCRFTNWCAQTQRHYSDYTHYHDGDPTYPLTTLVGIGVGQQTGQGIQLAWKSCHQSTSE